MNKEQVITFWASQPGQPYADNRPSEHPGNRVCSHQPGTFYRLSKGVDENSQRYPKQKAAPEKSFSQAMVFPGCHHGSVRRILWVVRVGASEGIRIMGKNFSKSLNFTEQAIESSGSVRSAESAMGRQFCPAATQRTHPRLHRRQRWEPSPRSELSGEQ